jgi:hypothetical protein
VRFEFHSEMGVCWDQCADTNDEFGLCEFINGDLYLE